MQITFIMSKQHTTSITQLHYFSVFFIKINYYITMRMFDSYRDMYMHFCTNDGSYMYCKNLCFLHFYKEYICCCICLVRLAKWYVVQNAILLSLKLRHQFSIAKGPSINIQNFLTDPSLLIPSSSNSQTELSRSVFLSFT